MGDGQFHIPTFPRGKIYSRGALDLKQVVLVPAFIPYTYGIIGTLPGGGSFPFFTPLDLSELLYDLTCVGAGIAIVHRPA